MRYTDMNKLKERVKTLLGIEDYTYDEIIEIHIEDTIQIILNHCNIDELPHALYFAITRFVMTYMRGSEDFKGIAKTSFGDTSVTYNTTPIDKDSVLNNMAAQLNRFRKLDWT